MRYMMGEQVRILLLTLAALGGVHLSISVLDKLRTFLSHDAGFFVILQYFALELPKIVSEVVPFALLIATVVGLGALSARSEITAMRAAGVGILKLVTPLVLVGLLVSLAFAWASMSFIPRANHLSGRVYQQIVAGASDAAVFSRNRIWFRADSQTLFGIRTADLQAGEMWGIRILETDGDGGIRRLTTAEQMHYLDGVWQLKNAKVMEGGRGEVRAPARHDTMSAPLMRPPEALGQVSVPHYELSYKRLSRYIQRLKADGYAASAHEVDLARRLAFPFSSLIMVLVAIPYGLTPPRNHSLARGVGIALTIALAYWLLYSLSLALGRAEMLPPLASGWLPIAVFAAYGVYRLMAVRQ